MVKLKDKYMSERPHGDQKKGGLIHIVAADWMERVINSTDDVVVRETCVICVWVFVLCLFVCMYIHICTLDGACHWFDRWRCSHTYMRDVCMSVCYVCMGMYVCSHMQIGWSLSSSIYSYAHMQIEWSVSLIRLVTLRWHTHVSCM